MRADPGTSLRAERFEGRRGPEVVVYVVKPLENVPATARGAKRVEVRCFDDARRVLVRGRHPWPFTDTDDGTLPAHVHQRAPRASVERVRRCELAGTRGPLRGPVTQSSF